MEPVAVEIARVGEEEVAVVEVVQAEGVVDRVVETRRVS